MRTLPWDWHPGFIPENVQMDETAYVETTYSFDLYRSLAPTGARFGKASSAYRSTMFDLGPKATVTIGDYALLNGARIVCDCRVEIGDYALISWNVVIMDTYRAPLDPTARRLVLEQLAISPARKFSPSNEARPIRIGANVWIGFDTCVLPGATIGDGSIVGARSVVAGEIPPYTVAVGNPARIVRTLDKPL